MPSSPNPKNNEPHRPICGDKFREMLSCVENAAAVAPCNRIVNEFLACERAVFRAALEVGRERSDARSSEVGAAAVPSHASSSSSSSADTLPIAPTKQSPESSTSSSSASHQQQDSAATTATSTSTAAAAGWQPSFLPTLQRAAQKQAEACEKLVAAAAHPDIPFRVASFASRIAADFSFSARLVGARLADDVRHAVARMRDPPPPSPPPSSTPPPQP